MRELTPFVDGRYDAIVRGEVVSSERVAPESTGKRRPRCPTCREHTDWVGHPQRPFCSLTCRLIDLGVWLDERYRIGASAPPDVS